MKGLGRWRGVSHNFAGAAADGEQLVINRLAAWLSQKKTDDVSFNSVIVRGDLNSSLQATVDVLAACRVAGIEKVKIETQKPST